jgi:hypothetical protein
MSAATAGIATSDAGVASAMVNTTQQVGGAVGTALLKSSSQRPSRTTSRRTAPVLPRSPQPRSRATARPSAATGIFVAGAIVTAPILPSGMPAPAAELDLAFAH